MYVGIYSEIAWFFKFFDSIPYGYYMHNTQDQLTYSSEQKKEIYYVWIPREWSAWLLFVILDSATKDIISSIWR